MKQMFKTILVFALTSVVYLVGMISTNYFMKTDGFDLTQLIALIVGTLIVSIPTFEFWTKKFKKLIK